MGLLETLFTASLTAGMTSDSVKRELEKANELINNDENTIILSHEKSILSAIDLSSLRKSSLENEYIFLLPSGT